MSENGSSERVRTQNLNDEPTENDADTPKSGKQDKRPRRNCQVCQQIVKETGES